MPATFIRVRWQWIVLPAGVWAFGLVPWVVVVIQTWRLQLPNWRNDLLPPIFLFREDSRHGDTSRGGDQSTETEVKMKSQGQGEILRAMVTRAGLTKRRRSRPLCGCKSLGQFSDSRGSRGVMRPA